MEYLLLSGATSANTQNAGIPDNSTLLLKPTQAIPSGATSFARELRSHVANAAMVDRGALCFRSTAGSGTMTGSFRLWLGAKHFDPATGTLEANPTWYPVGTGTDANKGLINVAATIGEVSTDLIRHLEMIFGFADMAYLYVQAVSIGGTATAVDCILRTRQLG